MANIGYARVSTYEQTESIKLPITRQGVTYHTLIDKEDYERVTRYKWYYNGRYAVKTRGLMLHRYVLNAPKGLTVDHINGDKLDNRKSNLRLATSSQQSHNRKKPRTNKSGYKGVYYESGRRRYIAYVCVNGKRIYAGSSIDPAKAALFYDKAARKHYGEFAKLNYEKETIN